ncbi:MAG: RNase adapter RapZ [Lachnospiraceae bacterium]|nr:RNase adapter RapZ [Lachnospiraceae bacterium]
MRMVIVTGMSGAGKSTVMNMLEDMGYYCVDNLPVFLLGKFHELWKNSMGEIEKVALGIDIRSGEALAELYEIISHMDKGNDVYEILYLDASDTTLIKRYKETRRTHPLAVDGRVEDGIKVERDKLSFLKEKATYIIDTDNLLVRDLKAEIEKIFVENKKFNNLYINVLSFGFKHGIPVDSDLVFDVRFMPNPYYVENLRKKTGNDKEVRDFVMNSETSKEFVNKLTDMVKFLIPNYIAEGKNQLVVSIGCAGGHHRSVTVANMLYEALQECDGYGLKVSHRDIDRG